MSIISEKYGFITFLEVNYHSIDRNTAIWPFFSREGWQYVRGFSFTFRIAQKVTKTLIAQKTHLAYCSLARHSSLLAACPFFRFLFFSSVIAHEPCCAINRTPRCSNSFERQSLLPEMISKKPFGLLRQYSATWWVPIRDDFVFTAPTILDHSLVPIRNDF